MTDTEAKIRQLQRHFGNNIDHDVLESVLLLTEGDVNNAIQFLTAPEGQPAVNLNQPSQAGLPHDYPVKTKQIDKPHPAASATKEELIPLHDEVATIKELFVQETSLHDHYATAQKDTALYVATVILLLYRDVEISKGSTCLSWLLSDTVLVSSDPTSYFHSWVGRAKLLATLWCLKYYDVADYLLATYKEVFALPEVLRALQLLDSGRRIRAIEKKIARLETQNTVKGHKINILKGQINDLKKEASIGSVSGALSKKIRRWIRNISREDLEYFALNMPKEPWRELADIVHLSPTDFQCPWFLSVMFGGEPPRDSLLSLAANVTAETLVDVINGRTQVAYDTPSSSSSSTHSTIISQTASLKLKKRKPNKEDKTAAQKEEGKIAKEAEKEKEKEETETKRRKTEVEETEKETRKESEKTEVKETEDVEKMREVEKDGFREDAVSDVSHLRLQNHPNTVPNVSPTEQNVTTAREWRHPEVHCAIPYSYLRVQMKSIPSEAKILIASYASLDTLIWYHEELVQDAPAVNDIIAQRLQHGEMVTFSYGKLMERLLYFKGINAPFYHLLIPQAEKRLRSIFLELEPPVVVLGDASYSMDVAIRTATIIASVLTVLTNAELRFFHTQCIDPPLVPKTCEEVVTVATQMRAGGLTASASALWPYYQQRKIVKTFIVVTDEIENVKFRNEWYFPSLFMKYYQEVYPAKLAFVSFLENPTQKGRMVTALENFGFKVLQFRLDGTRPDLTKLDTLLGLLSSESSHFPVRVLELANAMRCGGLAALLTLLTHRQHHTDANTANVNVTVDIKDYVRQQQDCKNNQPLQELHSLRESCEVKEGNLCIICQEKDHKRTHALMECGHFAFCETCATKLLAKECPLCRRLVIKIVRIYDL
jgi:hypothetical protein